MMLEEVMDEVKRKCRIVKVVLICCGNILCKKLKEGRFEDEIIEVFYDMKVVFENLVVKYEEYM